MINRKDIMTPKQYLMQPINSLNRIRAMCVRLQELHAMTGPHSASLETKVQTSKENMQEDILVKCLDLKKEINEALFQYLIQKDDVINQIQKLNDYRYLVILYEHYIPDKKGHVKTLHEIAVEHDWCDEHTYYLHWQAVKALNDVLPPSILAAEGVSAF